jgi:hypothetical protein
MFVALKKIGGIYPFEILPPWNRHVVGVLWLCDHSLTSKEDLDER